MYRRVLVPLDGSPVAEAILPFIERIAGPLDMEIVLVRVVPLTSLGAMELTRQAGAEEPFIKEQEARQYLEPLAEGLTAKGVRADGRVRLGHPPAEIVAVAKEVGADLIAMTTHGRSGLGRLLFGSVAEEVLRSAPVPVFLMRMTEAALGSGAPAGRNRA
jgi:nucleotide-binding universal stress UspA family protein